MSGIAKGIGQGDAARPSPAALVLAAVIVVVFVVHAAAWRFLCDDAFISFRYAGNLAEHGALVFNPHISPPEVVEGYTNFLWVLVLAGGAAVGLPPPDLAPWLTRACALGALAAATWLTYVARRRLGAGGLRRLEGRDLVPALVLVAQPELMVWSHSGLETAAAAGLVVGAMAAWIDGRLRLAAGLSAAAVLTRPDAALPIATCGLTWLAVAGVVTLRRDGHALRAVPWRRVAVAAAIFVVPVLGHLVWRRAYYGAWVPNTWAIKSFGRLLRDANGVAYVEAWNTAVRPWVWLALLPMLRPRHLVVALPAAAVVGYGWWVGGDFMAYSRFYVVATVLTAVLGGWLLADAAAWVARTRPGLGFAAAASCLALGAGLAAMHGASARTRHDADTAKGGWIDGRWEGVTAMDRFARVGLVAGAWMREHIEPQTLISVGAAGAVPYASGLQIVDGYGLVDPKIATLPGVKPHTGDKARPGHQIFAPSKYIKARDPSLLCHVGYRGKKKPSRRRVHPSFRRGYVWACIDMPPVPDPRSEGGELPGGFYCCLRPRDRVVGPFGTERGT